jgi:hypothetical protein
MLIRACFRLLQVRELKIYHKLILSVDEGLIEIFPKPPLLCWLVVIAVDSERDQSRMQKAIEFERWRALNKYLFKP